MHIQLHYRLTIALLLLAFAGTVYGQDETIFPQNYYQFPINPGQQGYLAGKTAEIRPNHFHGGLDIKTGGVEGWDVHAAADGYIYRLKVSAYGYGKVLYVMHPNGQRSVYAHLSEFTPAVEAYIRKNQYEKQQFEVELFPAVNQFAVKKGEIIAQSGNSGGSGAPHLHFEIRNKEDEPLKALRFGFQEVKDTVEPWIRELAINPLDMFSRVSGAYARAEVKMFQKGNEYKVYNKIRAHGRIGLELYAFDKANEVHNIYGIYRLEVWVNGIKHFQQQIDKFSFFNSRQIHRYINYSHYAKRKQSFQRCYRVDGNELPFYADSPSDGVINIIDGREYEIEIRCYDVFENLAKVSLTIVGDKQAQPPSWNNLLGSNFRVDENTFFFYKDLPIDSAATVVAGEFGFRVPPAYRVGNSNVYLWNLKKGIPNEVVLGKDTVEVPLERMIPSGITYFYTNPNMDIFFGKNTLYDTLYLYTESNGKNFSIGDRAIPMPNNMEVTYRPGDQELILDKERTRVYQVRGGWKSYKGGKWDGEAIRFSTKNMGEFTLITDTDPPELRTLAANAGELRFYTRDRLSGIKDFRVTVNGKWVLMHYDYKTRQIWSAENEKNRPFSGEVKVTVTDEVGNEAVEVIQLP